MPLTSFVGRQAEIADVTDLVRANRLVTLTGAGGSGKTRLALHVAHELACELPDGVRWLDLAPLSDASLVPAALAAVLGMPEPAEPIPDTVVRHLSSRRALVVFDNCEHLIEACAAVTARIAQSCAGVTVMATSRELLGVAGEVRYPVPPLGLPGEEGVAAGEAARLFVERAKVARPTFELTEANAAAVSEICHRLDGIPLAIELAAARVRVLSVAQIAEGLQDRFHLLTGSTRGALPRQRTLEGSVDWSFDLLEADERAAFRRLGAFSGTFTLDAAEAVCADCDIAGSEVLDIVSALVDKSLVQVVDLDGSRTRYRLLETIRDYARHKLADAGEAEQARDRHLAWCGSFAARAAVGLEGDEPQTWLAMVDAELDNLRGALDWSTRSSNADTGMQIVGRLILYWFARSEVGFGRLRLEAAVARGSDGPDRADGLTALCHVAYRAGDMAGAARLGDEAIALARRIGDPGVLGRALHFRAWVRFWGEGDATGAWRDFEEADGLLRATPSRVLLGLNSALFGWSCIDTARVADARALLDEGIALTPPMSAARAYALFAVGWLDYAQGRTERALEGFRAALRVAREAGDHYIALLTWALLGISAASTGDHEQARVECEAALNIAREHRIPMGEASVRFALAMLDLASGDIADASAELERAFDRTPMPWFAAIIQGYRAHAALELGRPAHARELAADALRRGRACDSVSAVTHALISHAALAALDGDSRSAEDLLHDALDVSYAGGFQPFTAEVLDRLAAIAAEQGRPEEAVRVLSSVAHGRSPEDFRLVGAPPPDELFASLTDTLGHDAVDAAWIEGAAMSLEDAVALVRRGRGRRGRPTHGWDSLTPTERKVVDLVAEGLTNPQIGHRLFVSPRTVQTHLAHVFAKLDVSTRAELAAAASRRASRS